VAYENEAYIFGREATPFDFERRGPDMPGQEPPTSVVEELLTVLFSIFKVLALIIRRQLSAEATTKPAMPLPEPRPMQPDPATYDDTDWEGLLIELPTSPPIDHDSWPKLYNLAKELKGCAPLMTAGRDLHFIHTLLHLVGHWTSLDNSTHSYAALLNIAIT
jgi:hypothetical protein